MTGRLGRTPELRHTQTGKAVTNISLANSTGFGENKQTHWFTVVVWNGQAEAACNYLKKGAMIGVEGSLQTRSWEDRDGNDRISVEIVANRIDFLDSKGSSANETSNQPPTTNQPISAEDDAPF
jgi:single-strand DNA-binding protein